MVGFRKYNPNVEGVAWIIQQNNFVAHYQVDETTHQLWLSEQGKILKHALVIDEEHLPSLVQQAIFKKFPSGKITDVYKIDVRSNYFYQVRIKNLREKIELLTDDKGHEIQHEKTRSAVKVSMDD